jgi:L-seryl-tRNA(Ser) seleniumtransferase
LIQRAQIYQYDRAVSVVGAKLLEIGTERGTTTAEFESAFGPRTAMVLYPAHLDEVLGVLSLEQVVAIARRHGVPVFVDAAAQVYPLERFTGFIARGADLVCYSTKYFGGPNSTGILIGRADLIDAAVPQGFIGFETVTNRKGFGRPFKLDRQEIVAVVVAVQEWLTMDHAVRLAGLEQRIARISTFLQGLPGVTLELLKRPGSAPRVLRVTLDAGSARRDVPSVVAGLKEGQQMIYVNADATSVLVNPGPLHDDDVDIVGQRMRALLS